MYTLESSQSDQLITIKQLDLSHLTVSSMHVDYFVDGSQRTQERSCLHSQTMRAYKLFFFYIHSYHY